MPSVKFYNNSHDLAMENEFCIVCLEVEGW
jgi:hypothetical protein